MHTRAQTHKHTELLTVGVPRDRRCQEVNIFPSLSLLPFPWRLNLQGFERWGGERKPWVCTWTHTHTMESDWPTDCEAGMLSGYKDRQKDCRILMNIQYTVCCRCMWVIVRLVGAVPSGWEGNTGGTDVYSVGSALNKLQLDLWCIPTGVLCVVFMFLCVSVNVCVCHNNDAPRVWNVICDGEWRRSDFLQMTGVKITWWWI